MSLLFPTFHVSASALYAQRTRMDLSSANLANAQTTRGPDGGPYKKLTPIFEAKPVSFDDDVTAAGQQIQSVEVTGVHKDETPPRLIYDPTHPDADKSGFVKMPNINLLEEMADMLLASRSYEANVTAFNMSKSMALETLNIGKI